MYKCDNSYVREAERGINFNDPELGIDWKVDPTKAIVSPKDEVLPAFSEAEMNFLYQEDEILPRSDEGIDCWCRPSVGQQPVRLGCRVRICRICLYHHG